MQKIRTALVALLVAVTVSGGAVTAASSAEATKTQLQRTGGSWCC